MLRGFPESFRAVLVAVDSNTFQVESKAMSGRLGSAS